jgi:hypothetical protein
MATKPTSTVPPVPSTLHTFMVLLTPVWIILAAVAHALVSAEVTL